MEEQVIFKSWWSFLLRGLIAIAIGIVLLAWTGATIKTLTVIIGLFALIDGLINVILAVVRAAQKESWGRTLAWGLFGLLLGAIILSHPKFTVEVVAVLAGIWAVVMGIAFLSFAFDLPPMSGRGWVGILGGFSIVLGIIILVYPFDSVYAFSVIMAIYALLAGALDIFLGFYVRRSLGRAKSEQEAA